MAALTSRRIDHEKAIAEVQGDLGFLVGGAFTGHPVGATHMWTTVLAALQALVPRLAP